jgi:transketolase
MSNKALENSPRNMVDAPFGQALVELGQRRPDVVALSADLSKYTDVIPFIKAFPQRFFNIGMAEQNLRRFCDSPRL